MFTQAVIQVEIKLVEGRGEAGGCSDPKVRLEGSQAGLGEGWNTEEESRAGDREKSSCPTVLEWRRSPRLQVRFALP